MNTTLLAFLGFLCWTLFLLVPMETVRSKLVLTRKIPANGFNPENSNLSPFMQRLARAHENCLEGFTSLWWLYDSVDRLRQVEHHRTIGLRVTRCTHCPVDHSSCFHIVSRCNCEIYCLCGANRYRRVLVGHTVSCGVAVAR